MFIAVCSSTAVGSWAIWHNTEGLGGGQLTWRALSALLVITTIVKPMLKLQDTIKAATERMSEYHGIYVESLALADDVRANDGFYKDETLPQEELLAKKLTAVEQKSAEEEISLKATAKWKAVVATQYPKTYFWFPIEGDDGEHQTKADQPAVASQRSQPGRHRLGPRTRWRSARCQLARRRRSVVSSRAQ